MSTPDKFNPGEEYEFRFDASGVYRYYCSLHGSKNKGMIGEIDATPTSPLAVAGAAGSGGGRDGASTAITNHVTNPLGLTAIGDGLEAAAAQLTGAGAFAKRATVVFTDGHETTDKYISQVMGLINSQVT